MTDLSGTKTRFRVHALPNALLRTVRETGVDVSGNPVERLVDEEGGSPLRCCLRNSRAGEALLLFGVAAPLPGTSPYREIGAVFAHAEPCGGPPADGGYPSDWYDWPQVLRSYDRRGWIHPTTCVHDGTDPEARIAEILDDPEVVQIHSRNIAYGCFMFTVTRADADADADAEAQAEAEADDGDR